MVVQWNVYIWNEDIQEVVVAGFILLAAIFLFLGMYVFSYRKMNPQIVKTFE